MSLFAKQICLSLRPAAVFAESKTTKLELPRLMVQGRLAKSLMMAKLRAIHRIASSSVYWQMSSCYYFPHAKSCHQPASLFLPKPCYINKFYCASGALQNYMLGFEKQARTGVVVSLLDPHLFSLPKALFLVVESHM